MKTVLYFFMSIIILTSCSNTIQQNESKKPTYSSKIDSLIAYYKTFEREHIIVKVDTIIAPTNIKYGDKLIAKFYGTISTGGCANLDSVVQATIFGQGMNSIKTEFLRFHATRVTDRRAECAAAAVTTLGGFGGPYVREFFPTNPGEFIIAVQQPDSTILKKIVIVN